MFSKWLKTRDNASWDQLIEAMRTIELNSGASDVEQLLVQVSMHVHACISQSGATNAFDKSCSA